MLSSLGLGLGIVLLMVLISVPMVNHAQREQRAQVCRDNLARLLAAKERYILAKELKPGAPVSLEELLKASPELSQKRPVCPDGGEYHLNAAGELPTCTKAAQNHRLPIAVKKKTANPAGAAASAKPATPGK